MSKEDNDDIFTAGFEVLEHPVLTLKIAMPDEEGVAPYLLQIRNPDGSKLEKIEAWVVEVMNGAMSIVGQRKEIYDHLALHSLILTARKQRRTLNEARKQNAEFTLPDMGKVGPEKMN